MLTLGRRECEKVLIRVPMPDGGHTLITVVVLEVEGRKVRLGFDAPREVEILRPEYQPKAVAVPGVVPGGQ